MGKSDIKCEAIACWLFMASAVAMAIGAMMLPALVILAIREDRAVAKLGEGDAFDVRLCVKARKVLGAGAETRTKGETGNDGEDSADGADRD